MPPGTAEIALTPPPAGPGDVILPIPYATQKPYRNLCWAACAEMLLMAAHGGNIPLCSVVSTVAHFNCCQGPMIPPAYDRPVWPHVAYQELHYPFQPWDAPFKLDAIQHEVVLNRRPVQVYYDKFDGTGHTALIVGFYRSGDLHVHDPFWGSGRADYDSVYNAYGEGYWRRTWFSLGVGYGSPGAVA